MPKYITVNEFRENFGLREKNLTIIDNWIKPGYIPGAFISPETGEWKIPDEAWPPYKTTIKPNGDFYTSIATACCNRRRPCYQLYKLPESEFNSYVQKLIEAKVIYSEEIDGIDYYRPTIEAQANYRKNNRNALKKFVYTMLEIASKAVAEAAIKKALG